MGTHIHLIDHYVRIKSPIHRLDGRIKLIFTLALILCITLLPTGTWPVYIVIFSILLCLMIAADIGFLYLLKRSALSLPFLLAALPLIFKETGTTLTSFYLGNLLVTISHEGLIRFISLGLKGWLSVIAAILLASTTSYTELLQAMRSLKIPQLLVAVFGLMWRYLYLMVEEVDRLTRARLSRSGISSSPRPSAGGSLRWRARVTGSMAGNLFIRSLERSERVYHAMLSRGYDGEIRSLETTPLSGKEILRLTLVIILLFLLISVFSLLAGSK
jgi:cobalt/nickel transport system permease protein